MRLMHPGARECCGLQDTLQVQSSGVVAALGAFTAASDCAFTAEAGQAFRLPLGPIVPGPRHTAGAVLS